MAEAIFKPSEFKIEDLVSMIDTGVIALPDLQRPFVWDSVKVRDLFDSLYKGMPIGLIILWEIYEGTPAKPIGGNKYENAKYLVIDGQQRLTSLYSVMKNRKIVNRNFKPINIRISFNPLEEKFEVANAAIEKDPKWIYDISAIFENNATFAFTKKYIERLKEANEEVDEDIVASRIDKVRDITKYIVRAIELSPTLDPEEVAEIFVRINSKGKVLNQSNFILTLMSVYWDEGRKELESFCELSRKPPTHEKESPYNIIKIEPNPEHLVRSIVGYGFLRGRLKYAYLALKGKDFEVDKITEEVRKSNFEILKKAQKEVLDLTNWHDYIKEIANTGFVNDVLISSKTAFFVTYSFYLLLKDRGLYSPEEISSIIRQWFVFSVLTQRYTGSTENEIERDLSLFKGSSNVIQSMLEIMESTLTEDYWKITLPEELISSSVVNNAYLVYLASRVFKDVYVMFSDTKLKDYLNPYLRFKKKMIEVHHIFPKNYLFKIGIRDKKEVNQVANLVYIEYKSNIKVSDKSPKDYWPEMTKNFTEEKIKEMLAQNCIPENFYELDYRAFLEARRKLMAQAIKEYFKSLRKVSVYK